jgi:hypothetical protein
MARRSHHKHHRHKKHRLTPSWLRSDSLKIYVGIAVFCFIIAGALNFLVIKGTTVVDRVNNITEQLPEKEVIDKLLSSEEGKTLVNNQIDNLVSGDGSNINEKDLAKAKDAYKDKLSEDEIQKLKDAYKKYTGK